MPFEMIAIDADDTLWHSEVFYHEAHAGLAAVLAPYSVEREAALDVLNRIESVNLPVFGYGIKGFIISMVEAAIQVTGGQISAANIQKIIDIGRGMTSHAVDLTDHCAETVARLAETHPLMVITKGDLMDQQRKMSASGLARFFQHVEVVSEKTPEVYAEILHRHNLRADRFLMVGNAMRSDVLPVLALGGWAVHVPYALYWAHEAAEAPAGADGRFAEIDHLGLLPALVEKMEKALAG